MASRSEILSRLISPGIIAVVRTRDPQQVLPICQALVSGGVVALEITLTVPQAVQTIQTVSEHFRQHALVGAGSVLGPDTCRAVLEAGAQFVVSPVTRPDLVAIAHASERPVILGAYTPTEAQLAFEAGADLVKIFPADALGPSYIKALCGPLPHLKIIPTGGVDRNTAAAFLEAGCIALGVGSSLITPDILRSSNWTELTRLAQAFVQIANQHRASNATVTDPKKV